MTAKANGFSRGEITSVNDFVLHSLPLECPANDFKSFYYPFKVNLLRYFAAVAVT